MEPGPGPPLAPLGGLVAVHVGVFSHGSGLLGFIANTEEMTLCERRSNTLSCRVRPRQQAWDRCRPTGAEGTDRATPTSGSKGPRQSRSATILLGPRADSSPEA